MRRSRGWIGLLCVALAGSMAVRTNAGADEVRTLDGAARALDAATGLVPGAKPAKEPRVATTTRTPALGEALSVFNDPSEPNLFYGDIVQTGVIAGDGGVFTTFAETYYYTDPSSRPEWTQNYTQLRWNVDLNSDGSFDSYVLLWNGGPGVSGTFRRSSDNGLICTGSPSWTQRPNLDGYYQVTFPAACLANTPSLSFYTEMAWDSSYNPQDEYDRAPDFPGVIGPVPNAAYAVSTKLQAGQVKIVKVTGGSGIPESVGGGLGEATSVAAVSLNVTVTEPEAAGHLTVYPCGPRPLASNVNFVPGQTVPNAVVTPVSPEGTVCFFTSATTHILVDVNGWFPLDAAGFQALSPSRVFDTRDGSGGVPAGVKVGPNGTMVLQMTGRNGVPASGVGAVSLNVTVTEPSAPGFVTVYPCGTRPVASNLNYATGQTIANAVIAPVSASGQVCFYSLQATHLLADVNGWFPVSPASLQSLTPTRLFDTRDGTGGVPANTRVPGGGTVILQVTGTHGVPAGGVAAVALNVTVTDATGPGFVTVYPCGTRPLASNLNYTFAGQTVPNMVLAPVSPSGQVCFYVLTAAHLLADLSGWFPVSAAGFQALTPFRLFDTRG